MLAVSVILVSILLHMNNKDVNNEKIIFINNNNKDNVH